MANDDSFIREVDEQIRQDRTRDLWSRYGLYVISLAVAVVLGTAAYHGWNYYRGSVAAGDGDAFLEAIERSGEEDGHDEALAALERIAEGGNGQYPTLARLRLAGERAQSGDAAGALAMLDAIAADSAQEEIFRDLARLRAGLLAVDLEEYDAVRARLEPMAAEGESFRHSAREGLGIAALKAGDEQAAFDWFQSILDDSGSTSAANNRAEGMLDLLAGRGVKKDEDEEEEE